MGIDPLNHEVDPLGYAADRAALSVKSTRTAEELSKDLEEDPDNRAYRPEGELRDGEATIFTTKDGRVTARIDTFVQEDGSTRRVRQEFPPLEEPVVEPIPLEEEAPPPKPEETPEPPSVEPVTEEPFGQESKSLEQKPPSEEKLSDPESLEIVLRDVQQRLLSLESNDGSPDIPTEFGPIGPDIWKYPGPFSGKLELPRLPAPGLPFIGDDVIAIGEGFLTIADDTTAIWTPTAIPIPTVSASPEHPEIRYVVLTITISGSTGLWYSNTLTVVTTKPIQPTAASGIPPTSVSITLGKLIYMGVGIRWVQRWFSDIYLYRFGFKQPLSGGTKYGIGFHVPKIISEPRFDEHEHDIDHNHAGAVATDTGPSQGPN